MEKLNLILQLSLQKEFYLSTPLASLVNYHDITFVASRVEVAMIEFTP